MSATTRFYQIENKTISLFSNLTRWPGLLLLTALLFIPAPDLFAQSATPTPEGSELSGAPTPSPSPRPKQCGPCGKNVGKIFICEKPAAKGCCHFLLCGAGNADCDPDFEGEDGDNDADWPPTGKKPSDKKRKDFYDELYKLCDTKCSGRNGNLGAECELSETRTGTCKMYDGLDNVLPPTVTGPKNPNNCGFQIKCETYCAGSSSSFSSFASATPAGTPSSEMVTATATPVGTPSSEMVTATATPVGTPSSEMVAVTATPVGTPSSAGAPS